MLGDLKTRRSQVGRDCSPGEGDPPVKDGDKMADSVIRSDGSVVWSVGWLAEPKNTVEIDDDIFSAYRNWYEGQIMEENPPPTHSGE